MTLQLLTIKDFADALAGKAAYYTQLQLTRGNTREVVFLLSQRRGDYILEYQQVLWIGPAAFASQHADDINAKADSLMLDAAQAGITTLKPGRWHHGSSVKGPG